MNKTYFLLVNGDYFVEGDFAYVKNQALQIKRKAEKGILVNDEIVKTVEIAMFNISVYDDVLDEK